MARRRLNDLDKVIEKIAIWVAHVLGTDLKMTPKFRNALPGDGTKRTEIYL